MKQKSALRVTCIANFHQIPNYFTDTRTHCKTFNILPLPSLLVYYNSLYGYQIFSYSVPEFVSKVVHKC